MGSKLNYINIKFNNNCDNNNNNIGLKRKSTEINKTQERQVI